MKRLTIREAMSRYGWPLPMAAILRLFVPALFRAEPEQICEYCGVSPCEVHDGLIR